jgi:hypothetical protein
VQEICVAFAIVFVGKYFALCSQQVRPNGSQVFQSSFGHNYEIQAEKSFATPPKDSAKR